MSAEPALLDTNILVYAFDPEFEYHPACRRLLLSASDRDATLCLVPQIVANKRRHVIHEE